MECQADEETETPDDEEMPENPEVEEEEKSNSNSEIEPEQLNSEFDDQSSEIPPATSLINQIEFVQSPGPARFKKLTLAPLHTLQEPRVVEPLKISLPPLSPHSNCSSSSESACSVNISQKKKKKRLCTLCNLQFRHKIDFLNHHKSHVSLPTISIKRLSVKDFQFQEYIKRQKERVLCARKKTGPPNLYNTRTTLYQNIAPAPPKYNPEGLKLKLKMSGGQNFEVVQTQNIKIENEAEMREQQQREHLNRIRILTAREIKASPPHSPRPPNIPLNPLEAMYELTSINNSMPNFMKSPGDKIHFECPTLDGLDQFHMENDKDAAAALLKQLLESPQLPQENEWHNSSTSEFISIDRLAHICTICHSNFPDAVMLYEHKRITGHGFENMMHPLPPHQQQQQRRPINIQPQMNRFGQNMPMEQLAQQVRSMPMHPGQPPRYIQPNQMGPPYLQQQQQPRRPPPPLYRPQGPNPGQQQQQQQQPQHRFNLMQMNYHPNHPNHPSANHQNHPNHQIQEPLFRGINQNGPGMNGGGIVMNNFQNQMRPQQHGPPQQQQQQQMGGMMRPPGPMMRLQHPPPPLRPEMRPGPLQMKRPGNFLQQMRASPNNTPSPPTMKKPGQLMTPPPPKKIRVDDGDDCQLISMQPRSDGLPIIQSVQGGAPPIIDRPQQQQKSKESIHLSDQITLSIKSKDAAQNKNPKDVANILANRGITVTPSAKMKEQQLKMQQQGKSGGTNSSAEDAVQKLQLNSSVSIISKKKSIDLTNDDVTPATKKIMDEYKPIQPNLKNSHDGLFIPCTVPECDQKFLTSDSLQKHLQRGHKHMSLRIHKCKICPAKFSTTDGLAFHQKKVHNIHKTTADELGLPIVDLRNDETRNKLAALGIINYIPLTNLNKTTGGTYGLPIISVQGAANNAICNIMAMGADSVLSLGPVKPIPIKTMLN